MANETLGSDTVLWLGEKRAAFRDLIAAKFRVIDKAPSGSERFGVIALYWHFVDAVWIVVFTVVYLIGR